MTDVRDPRALAEQVVRLATEQGVRIAVAESLTGGLLAAEIVGIPGASLVFSGGIVAYDTSLKCSLLEVDAGLLASRGPVDPEVARRMARGVRVACAVTPDLERPELRSPADIGVATTGVAGPDPDPQTGQPAGTVWVGISADEGEQAYDVHLEGGRDEIRAATVIQALERLIEHLDR